MHFHFSKMHGLGNDFMVVDCITQNVFFSPELIRRLADRHTGVGFDQLLIVEAPMILKPIFITGFLMPMAVKLSSAGMAPVALPVLSG